LGLPISYKETFILIVIVAVLLFKPEWLFTFRKRKI
jgi:branched-subunit amino acid ABC-type transport system permease component